MALSTCDAGKWFTIQKWLDSNPRTARDQHKSLFNCESCDAIGQLDADDLQSPRRLRQSQKRLTSEQTARMCQKYRNGATVYELGREFGIDRRTVAIRMKKAGVIMRGRDVGSNSAVPI